MLYHSIISLEVSEKRGRPLSSGSDDPAALRRREAWRRQQQNHRSRQRRAHAAPTQATNEQLQQGEQIVNLALTAEEDAAVTLTQLGLRVQGVTIAQDAADAPEQQQVSRGEHNTLYEEQPQAASKTPQHQPIAIQGFFHRFAAGATAQPSNSRRSQQPLAQIFRILPPSNPLSPYPCARPNSIAKC